MPEFESQRHVMVETQIVARGITESRVLEAMREVPRHLFVPPAMASQAYEDRPVPIGEGQTISQPFIVAVMTAVLKVENQHRVLEIGTGSGYQAAILARLASHVVSVERHPALAESARRVLNDLSIGNVTVVTADGTDEPEQWGSFDRILVTAGAPAIPEMLQRQLSDGGRLVVPVGPPALQHLTVVERHGDRFESREMAPCVFVPLVGRGGWPA